VHGRGFERGHGATIETSLRSIYSTNSTVKGQRPCLRSAPKVGGMRLQSLGDQQPWITMMSAD
jgi:hypothetical protein